jgi:hypothetical protein
LGGRLNAETPSKKTLILLASGTARYRIDPVGWGDGEPEKTLALSVLGPDVSAIMRNKLGKEAAVLVARHWREITAEVRR